MYLQLLSPGISNICILFLSACVLTCLSPVTSYVRPLFTCLSLFIVSHCLFYLWLLYLYDSINTVLFNTCPLYMFLLYLNIVVPLIYNICSLDAPSWLIYLNTAISLTPVHTAVFVRCYSLCPWYIKHM